MVTFKPRDFDISNIDKTDYEIVDEKEILSTIEKNQIIQIPKHIRFQNYTDQKYGFTITYPYNDELNQITINTGSIFILL